MADIALESFDDVDAYISQFEGDVPGQHVFMLPRWLKAWRQAFSRDDELHLCLVRTKERLIGLAPLAIHGTIASFAGDPEIADYMDFAVTPGWEKVFYDILLADLRRRNVRELDLRCLRPESTVFSHLQEAVSRRNGTCSFAADGTSIEMDLPADWDTYLSMLSGKQRHEIRRKFRRLNEEAGTHFVALDGVESIADRTDVFLKMFRESRSDKAAFMNPQMESFFRSMMRAMSAEGILRLFVLELDGLAAAACLCFDYQDTMFLYNSGYNPEYSSLSVGLLCKILSIRRSIETGRKKYDFLKGIESYKYFLGGKEVRLSRCRISLS